MNNKLNNIKTKTIIATSLLLPMLGNNVYADDGDGGFNDAMNTIDPILSKLKRPLSIGVNIVCFGLALYCIVSGVISLVKSFQEENPNDARNAKDKAVRNLIGAGIAITGVLIINVILSMLGIPSIFTA